MKKIIAICALLSVAAATVSWADSKSYSPSGATPYLWATEGNWTGGTRPGPSDDAELSDANLVAEALVLGAGEVETVSGLYVGKSVTGNTTVGPYKLEIAGTLTNTATAYIGYKAAKSEPDRSGMVTVKNGGEWVSKEQLYVGYGAGRSTLLVEAGGKVVVTNGTTSSMYVGGGFASPGVVTNYGTILIDRDLDIGNNITGNDNAYGEFHNYGEVSVGSRLRLGMNGGGNPTVFHQHKGAKFTKTRLYNNPPYTFYIGYRSLSYFIMDDDITLPAGEIVAMGINGGITGHLVLNEAAQFNPGGEIRMGYSGSVNYLWMNGTSRIVGSPTINVGYTTNSKGYVTLSNESAIVSTGNLNIGGRASGTSLSNGGYVDLWDSSAISAGKVNVGVGGKIGQLTLHDNSRLDGTASLQVGLRAESQSCVIFSNSASAFLSGSVRIGDVKGGFGSLTLADQSTFTATGGGTNVLIGAVASATGVVAVADFATMSVLTNLYVGHTSGSGSLIVKDGGMVTCSNLHVGAISKATGTLVVTNGGLVVCTNIIVSADGGSNERGTVVIHEGGMVSNSVIKVGDYANTSYGLLEMRGGTMLFNASATMYNPLRLYSPGHANGAVRGWGVVAFTDPRAMVTEASRASGFGMAHYGQIIADGGGVERDLDFSRFGVLCYDNTAPNTCGTNGWFAVNKGRLKLPRCLSRKADAPFCTGDYYGLNYSVESRYANSSNRLANTFSCVFTGSALNNFIFSELYAPDRSDIPTGIDALGADRTISVWRVGLFSDGPEIDDPASPETFTSAKLHFRFPNDNLDDLALVCVYRHDGTANGKWRLVGRTKVRKGWPVVPANVSAPSAENWNLGWFAVVGRKAPFGTMFIMR